MYVLGSAPLTLEEFQRQRAEERAKAAGTATPAIVPVAPATPTGRKLAATAVGANPLAELFLAKMLDLAAKRVIDEEPRDLKKAIPLTATEAELRALVAAVEQKNAGKPARAASTAAIRAAFDQALVETSAPGTPTVAPTPTAAASDSTGLYVGLGVAAVVALLVLRR